MSQRPALVEGPPVVIVGAGPVGLITALGLAHHGIACEIYEDDDRLSLDTKAGTILSRTLEILHRYGAADAVLAQALRVDEIGEIDRQTQQSTFPVMLQAMAQETRYPFVINLPQHDLEPVLLREALATGLVRVNMKHRYVEHKDEGDRVLVHLEHEGRPLVKEASFLLACDGGRSSVREQLGVSVQGESLPVKYALVDLVVDLDVANPRDYPYLAYFADPQEWMILIRHPHCWRFLYPLAEGAPEPTAEELRDKSLSFIGQVGEVKVLNRVTYRVHHRVASRWTHGRVLLMGDAAHLITPMWALGLNTGALDASNLPWRLAWYLRGWAQFSLIEGYEREQRPLAVHGSGVMAEAARLSMAKRTDVKTAMSDNNWTNAHTRTMLGVRLDVQGTGQWSLVSRATRAPVMAGDRLPDGWLHTPQGQEQRLHDICRGRFTALYFADVRRRPGIPSQQTAALQHWVVSRWDAPHDSGLRDRSLLDPGSTFTQRMGVAPNTLVLIRPDEHVAAVVPMDSGSDVAERLYQEITGKPSACSGPASTTNT
jgi:3-(3-hydroxy-phenyl)propionate hydroxylase